MEEYYAWSAHIHYTFFTNVSYNSAQLRADHTEIELEYTLNKIPELNIPYEYKPLNLTLDLKTGEEKHKYGFSSDHSLYINNMDIRASKISKSVFPLTVYGISEIMYVITLKRRYLKKLNHPLYMK